MSQSTLQNTLLLVLVVVTVQNQLAASSDVLDLGDADFDYIAAEHDTMLVEFFAPW